MAAIEELSDLPQLPAGFRFGASTASYQIEGSTDADGRGPSVWDTFCAEPGRIKDGSSGAIACDSYRRWRDDVALLADLGAHAYRFSIAWPRILPTGRGEVNRAGLDHYDRFVDALLEAGIDPMVTLFHWDLPQALETAGGWMERATAEAFGDYAGVVGEQLADRVAAWMPVNEPNVVTVLGYASGVHAPGRTLGLDALPVAHHLLLGHGLAVAALRAAGAKSVGTAHNLSPAWPATADPADVRAAALYDELWNRLFTDPVLLGRYPEALESTVSAATPDLAADLEVISAPLDFFGFNYYQPTSVRAPGSEDLEGLGPPLASPMPVGVPFELAPMPSYPATDFGWPIVPEGLHEQLLLVKERYPDVPPIWITEQGCAFNVGPTAGPDGAAVVDDQDRIDYLDGHLRAVARAVEDGVDVAGYLSWSLLDNFEWAEGYTQRFGLVWVDFETGERVPKRSFEWYTDVIAGQTAVGGDPVAETV